MDTEHYKGWSISMKNNHYFAEQYGVTMNTNTEHGIKRMIDYRIYQQGIERGLWK